MGLGGYAQGREGALPRSLLNQTKPGDLGGLGGDGGNDSSHPTQA